MQKQRISYGASRLCYVELDRKRFSLSLSLFLSLSPPLPFSLFLPPTSPPPPPTCTPYTIIAILTYNTIHTLNTRLFHTHTHTHTQFFFTEKDIGKKCAETCLPRLAELNSYVRMELLEGALSEEVIKKYQVVVLTQSSFEEQKKLGDFCHDKGIRFIVANTKGLFG